MKSVMVNTYICYQARLTIGIFHVVNLFEIKYVFEK